MVLSRKKDEEVFVETPGGLVKVIVVEIRGDKVRLGFEAPTEMPVNRREVYEIQHEAVELRATSRVGGKIVSLAGGEAIAAVKKIAAEQDSSESAVVQELLKGALIRTSDAEYQMEEFHRRRIGV